MSGSQRRTEVPIPKVTEEALEVFRTQPNRFIIYKISPDWTTISHSYIAPKGATYGKNQPPSLSLKSNKQTNKPSLPN